MSYQAGIGVAEHQHCIRFDLGHQLIAARNDIAHGLAKVRADRVQVHLRIFQFQIMEEHAVQIVVIVLSRVRQNRVKIFPALPNHVAIDGASRRCRLARLEDTVHLINTP